MSAQRRKILGASLLSAIAMAITTFVLVAARAPWRTNSTQASPPMQSQRPVRIVSRNLSAQPEAFNLSRRLGKRFSPSRREKSVLVATLKLGSDQRMVQTIRTQTDDGEQVEIRIAGTPEALTWDREQGYLSSGARASKANRELIERLVFDSPDQFVLAQLRGASYYTLARNVRPLGAPDSYAGPTWTIVRVDDPEAESEKKLESRWRLYYINTVTGLVDRIVSDLAGEQIVAEVSGWTDVNGETVPTEIKWTRQGQTVMHYRLTNFSRA